MPDVRLTYCQQMDTHEPISSVREAILFSAVLYQPQNVPLAGKEAYVEKCFLMCGLEKYAGATIVGTLGVEQRKRLTISQRSPSFSRSWMSRPPDWTLRALVLP